MNPAPTIASGALASGAAGCLGGCLGMLAGAILVLALIWFYIVLPFEKVLHDTLRLAIDPAAATGRQ